MDKALLYGALLLGMAPLKPCAAAEAAVEKLLDRITRQEQQFAQALRNRSAILETYVQEFPRSDSDEVVRDDYFLGRLDFSKGLT